MRRGIRSWTRLLGASAVTAVTWLTPAIGVAQTTQPAVAEVATADAWQAMVEAFSRSMFEQNHDQARATLSKHVELASFNRQKVRGISDVAQRVAEGKLLLAQAYQTVPQSLALDIGQVIETSSLVPDAQKEDFIPTGEGALRHANETAAEWVRRSLQIEGSTGLVGVIVVWHPAPDGDDRKPGPVFILLRGKVGEKHEPVLSVTRIVVGSPIDS